MMAPGITVVYPIDAQGQTERQCALPWGIGVCDLVDKKAKTIEISVFLPTVLAAPEAPWSDWEVTTEKKTLSLVNPSWIKVTKLTRNKIPTKVLYRIWKEKKFNWQWISILNPNNDSVEPDFEFSAIHD